MANVISASWKRCSTVRGTEGEKNSSGNCGFESAATTVETTVAMKNEAIESVVFMEMTFPN